MYPPIEGFYDRLTAGALVRAAAAAYGDAEGMAAWGEEIEGGPCHIVENDRTDTLALVTTNRDSIFVVFRGTRDVRNWLTDLDARRVSAGWHIPDCDDGVEVHEGFLRALESVWEELAGLIGRSAFARRDLYFTGHSLGGALAMLACAWWESAHGSECPVSWVYTFGQPRVGNAAWRGWYNARWGARSFRVVHGGDVVARVPWLLGMYRHAGREIFYGGRRRLGRRGDGNYGKHGTDGEDAVGGTPTAATGTVALPKTGRGRERTVGEAARFARAGFVREPTWWERTASLGPEICRELWHGQLALLEDHQVAAYDGLINAERNAVLRYGI